MFLHFLPKCLKSSQVYLLGNSTLMEIMFEARIRILVFRGYTLLINLFALIQGFNLSHFILMFLCYKSFNDTFPLWGRCPQSELSTLTLLSQLF